MSPMIQIRNVPEQLHRKLKTRAAMVGMTLSDYLRREVERVAERPTLEEMDRRLKARRPVRAVVAPAKAVREERDRR